MYLSIIKPAFLLWYYWVVLFALTYSFNWPWGVLFKLSLYLLWWGLFVNFIMCTDYIFYVKFVTFVLTCWVYLNTIFITFRYVLFVSGLEFGSKDQRCFQMQMLADVICGQLGADEQIEASADICHVIIAGNSLSESTQDRDSITKVCLWYPIACLFWNFCIVMCLYRSVKVKPMLFLHQRPSIYLKKVQQGVLRQLKV